MPMTDLQSLAKLNRRLVWPGFSIVAAVCFLIPAAAGGALYWWCGRSNWLAIAGLLVGALLALSPKVAQQWERAVVLRLGRYIGLRGPGLFWVLPLVDWIADWIDQRTITTNFAAEQTLTLDTVPVNVDAVLFWMVYDPEKAALEVQDYVQAVTWAAQTALRDIIGRTSLTDLLRGREQIELGLQQLIDARTNPWGVTVQSVEMRDVVIPEALQDAIVAQGAAVLADLLRRRQRRDGIIHGVLGSASLRCRRP
jgi:regulator of protease activity HflC (stomatin/prohibitin superfamily)